MFHARRPRTARSLLVVLATVLVGGGLPAVASAEEPASSGTTVVGELVRAWPEHRDAEEAAAHGDDGPLTFVRTAAGDSVRVDTADVQDLPSGATVQLTLGRAVSDDATTQEGYEKVHDVLDSEVIAQPSNEPPPTSPAVTPVNHPVSVVMAVPLGGTRDSTTLSQVVQAVNDPVADFWSGQTDGGVKFGVTATRDWVNLAVGCSDPYALWQAAADAVGYTGAPDSHLVVYIGRGNTGCSDGLGTVGWDADSGGLAYVRYSTPSIIAHELGHNLGLGHSSLLQCNGTVNTPACRTTSYYDLYDVMGASWSQMGSLNVVQARQLQYVQTVQMGVNWTPENPATITLGAVSGRTGVRGIELLSDTGGPFWLEYRPASGQDSWLGTSANQFGLQPGVLLREESEGSDTSLLLDATPSPQSGWDADLQTALQPNVPVQVKTDAGLFEITVTGTTATDATVRVVPKSAVTVAYEASGGASGPMGSATMTEQVCGTLGGIGYCSRDFANGSIYWTPSVAGGAHLIYAPIFAAWKGAADRFVSFGFPTTDTTCGLAGGGCRQHFVNGNLYWTPGTGAVAVGGSLRTAYLAAGEESGALGYPTAAAVCSSADTCRQSFQGGMLASSPATGTRVLSSDIAAAWAAQNYGEGPLGYPTTDTRCGLRDGGCGQDFRGGSLYWSPATGAHPTYGAVRSYWIAQGRERGSLGYAADEMTCGSATCSQAFQGGLVVWSAAGSTKVLYGAMRDVWTATSGEAGPLRAPTTEITCGLVRGGCGQDFLGGSLYWSAATGAHPTYGAVRSFWIAQGRERGSLGYAADEMTCGSATCSQAFQGGLVVWSAVGGAQVLYGAMRDVWTATSGEAGPLRAPTTGITCGLVQGGCGQDFQGGSLYWSAGTGAHPTYGAIRSFWSAQGRERGALGYAAGEMTCGAATCQQSFQGGLVVWSAASGSRVLYGAMRQVWTATGGDTSPLGPPATDIGCGMVRGGCGQQFRNGSLYWSPATGAHPTYGAIRTFWMAQGWERGPLGYASGEMSCDASSCTQSFEGGDVTWTAAAGTTVRPR